jgi:alcohol dehydrogenase class IV
MFNFKTAGEIRFGKGAFNEIGAMVADWGKKALVVGGGTHTEPIRVALYDQFDEHGIAHATHHVTSEPATDNVKAGVEMARDSGCDFVVAVGGGSVIDAGKAIAGLLTNDGAPLDYLEVVGKGQKLANPAAPYLAAPTTAGTGTETTKNAVLYVPEHAVKVSLRSPYLYPKVAVIDPELTYSMPPSVTASTGLDALTQVLEPYVSRLATPLVDALVRNAIPLAAEYLPRAYHDGSDVEAREKMAYVSLIGGLALANAGLGAVHGFAGVLGGMLRAPHGLICASLLPYVFPANVIALSRRHPDHWAIPRYREIAVWLTGKDDATVNEGAAWLADLCEELKVPPLGELGLTEDMIPDAVEKSTKSSSMRKNAIPLTEEELTGILEAAL